MYIRGCGGWLDKTYSTAVSVQLTAEGPVCLSGSEHIGACLVDFLSAVLLLYIRCGSNTV